MGFRAGWSSNDEGFGRRSRVGGGTWGSNKPIWDQWYGWGAHTGHRAEVKETGESKDTSVGA